MSFNKFEDIESKLHIHNMVISGDDAWFCNYYDNALVNINLKEHTLKIKEKTIAKRPVSYLAMGKNNNWLILAPSMGGEILLYNLKSQEINRIAIEKRNCTLAKFMGVEIVDKKAFLIPYAYPAIVMVDLCTQKVKYYDSFINEIKEVSNSEWIFHLWKKTNNNCIDLICYNKNKVISFDMVNLNFSVREIFNDGKMVFDVMKTSNNEWISYDKSNYIIKKTGKNEKKILLNSYIKPDYIRIFKGKNSVYLFCLSTKKLLKINEDNEIIEILFEGNNICTIEDIKEASKHYTYVSEDGVLYYFEESENKLICVYKENIEEISLELCLEDYRIMSNQRCKFRLEKELVHIENNSYSLSKYLCDICQITNI